MAQTVTELTAYDATQMLGVVQALNNISSQQAADALTLSGITLLRVGVNQQVDVDGVMQLLALKPDLRLNLLTNGMPGAPSWQTQIALFKQLVATGQVESIEGPNETNGFGLQYPDGNGQGLGQPNATKWGTLAWARAMATAFPEVKRIYTTTQANMTSRQIYAQWAPNMAPYCTHTAIHKYPGSGGFMCNDDGAGNSPEYQTGLPWTLSWAQGATGIIPTVITETGTSGSDPIQPYPGGGTVTLPTHAKVVLANVLDCWALGMDRVFIYNLLSTYDPNNNLGTEAHYGILTYDVQYKPAGAAIRRLLDLLADPGAATTQALISPVTGSRINRSRKQKFAPSPLPVTLTGMDNTGSAAGTHLTFRKSDGSDLIITWNEPRIYQNDAEVVPPVLNVTVGWGASRTYAVVDMISGATVSSGAGSSVVVPLQGCAMAVRLNP